jgi:hypothetical protein
MRGFMDTEQLNELRRNEKLERIDIARLSSLLKHSVNHGEAEKLSRKTKRQKARYLRKSFQHAYDARDGTERLPYQLRFRR